MFSLIGWCMCLVKKLPSVSYYHQLLANLRVPWTQGGRDSKISRSIIITIVVFTYSSSHIAPLRTELALMIFPFP